MKIGSIPLFNPFALAALGLISCPSSAADISLTGLVVNTCVMTLNTPGTLAVASNGVSVSSQETGGNAATLGVVATGTAPTLSFTAPTLSGPAGWNGSPTVYMAYTSTGGANRSYTSSSSTYAMSGLLDTFTVQGKATNATGFTTGTYTLQSTVTCQQ